MTIWKLVQITRDSYGSDVEDIIGYFCTEKDAEEAKRLWDKDNLESENKAECTRIHTIELWESIKDFKEFWFSTENVADSDEEEHY
jgi:hypothetical protein